MATNNNGQHGSNDCKASASATEVKLMIDQIKETQDRFLTEHKTGKVMKAFGEAILSLYDAGLALMNDRVRDEIVSFHVYWMTYRDSADLRDPEYPGDAEEDIAALSAELDIMWLRAFRRA